MAGEEQRVLSIREATLRAFRTEGTNVMLNPSRFVGHVLDFVDTDAPEARVLGHCCDAQYLEPFVEAADARDPAKIEEAAQRAAQNLDYEWVIKEEVAQRLSCELAFALANHLGVSCSERIRSVATGGAVAPTKRHAYERADASNAPSRGNSYTTRVNGEDIEPSWSGGSSGEKPYQRADGANMGQGGAHTVRRAAPVSYGKEEAKRQAPPSSTSPSPTSRQQPITLSADRATRLYEIEINGTRMNGYRFMLVLCVLIAGMWGYNAVLIYWSVTQRLMAAYPALYQANFLYLGISVALVFLQLVSLVGLWGFRRYGPPFYLLSFGVTAVAPAIYWTHVYRLATLAPANVVVHYQPMEFILMLLFAAALWWLVSFVYLIRRWRFFDL